MADQLMRRGFLKISGDQNDRRVLRLNTMEKNAQFWNSRQKGHEKFMSRLFARLSSKELNEFNHLLLLLSERVSEYVEDRLRQPTVATFSSISIYSLNSYDSELHPIMTCPCIRVVSDLARVLPFGVEIVTTIIPSASSTFLAWA